MHSHNPRKSKTKNKYIKVPLADELVAMAAGREPEILRAAGLPDSCFHAMEGPCPFCPNSENSFGWLDGRIGFKPHCRKCFSRKTDPKPGDIIAAIKWIKKCEPLDAKKWLHGWLTSNGATMPQGEKESPAIQQPEKSHSEIVKGWQARLKNAAASLAKSEQGKAVPDELGVTHDALIRLGVGTAMGEIPGPAKGDPWKREFITIWPMRDGAGNLIGLTYRGRKTSRKARVKGSKNGLTYEVTLLDKSDTSRLYLTEGQTDCAAALSLGFDVVGLSSAGDNPAAFVELVRRVLPAEVVIVADRDVAGQSMAESYVTAVRVLVPVRLIHPPEPHKDLRAWVIAGADHAAVETLANAAELLPVVDGGDGGDDDEPLSPGADWPEPTEIGAGSLPAFPVDALPEPLRGYVAEVAEATQTPADLAGLLCLAFCSGAVMRSVEIQAGRGWREPVNLYVAILLDPANRKSEVFKKCQAPIKKIERERMEAEGPAIAKQESARRKQEKQMYHCEKRAAEKQDHEAAQKAEQIAEELASSPIPFLPKLLADDSTAEAVEQILAQQGGRLIVSGSEGGLFDIIAGRYANGATSFDAFLKCHAADDLRVDRVGGRKSIMIDRPAFAVAYTVQPQVIEGLAENPVFRGRGLIGRFAYAIPTSLIGKRKINPEPISERAAADYENLIRRLYKVSEDAAAEPEPQLLSLSTDASDEFMRFRGAVERRLGDGSDLEIMRDWGGKLCGLAARFAAIIHLVVTCDRSEPWRVPVSVDSMRSAILLAEYAVPHAARVMELMTAEPDEAAGDAVYILDWIRDRCLGEFTRRDAHNHGRARFDKSPERLDAALSLLVDRGWTRKLPEPERTGAGRKPSPGYAVNPAAIESAEPQGKEGSSDCENIRGVI